jgi:SM-20-related protein
MTSPLPTALRTHLIDGRRVVVYDGMASAAECAEYAGALAEAPFTRSEVATPKTAEYKHWVREFPLQHLAALPLFPRTQAALAPFSTEGQRYRAYRAYTNHAAYGDMLWTHTDCAPGAGELTALWYLCGQWDPEWGGETLFYDASGDAVACVTPRPGRLVIFDGDLRHTGRPPNRVCYAPRYTFAIKLERVRG